MGDDQLSPMALSDWLAVGVLRLRRGSSDNVPFFRVPEASIKTHQTQGIRPWNTVQGPTVYYLCFDYAHVIASLQFASSLWASKRFGAISCASVEFSGLWRRIDMLLRNVVRCTIK